MPSLPPPGYIQDATAAVSLEDDAFIWENVNLVSLLPKRGIYSG
jgi:hypothetical protein